MKLRNENNTLFLSLNINSKLWGDHSLHFQKHKVNTYIYIISLQLVVSPCVIVEILMKIPATISLVASISTFTPREISPASWSSKIGRTSVQAAAKPKARVPTLAARKTRTTSGTLDAWWAKLYSSSSAAGAGTNTNRITFRTIPWRLTCCTNAVKWRWRA